MKLLDVPQLSPEWWDFKVGKISGTRFGQVISDRDNRLIYDLVNEKLQGYIEQDEFENDDITFGKDNEPIARKLYSEISGIDFVETGCIISDFSAIHIASPDGVYIQSGDVLEIKCTQNGAIHIQRFIEGPETSHKSQIVNYFAVSDEVKRVHWVSYCPSRVERPLVWRIFTLDSVIKEATTRTPSITIRDLVNKGRQEILSVESEMKRIEHLFIF